jgi:hypothetical protein
MLEVAKLASGVTERREGTLRLLMSPSSTCAVVTVPWSQQLPCNSIASFSRSLHLPTNYS